MTITSDKDVNLDNAIKVYNGKRDPPIGRTLWDDDDGDYDELKPFIRNKVFSNAVEIRLLYRLVLPILVLTRHNAFG